MADKNDLAQWTKIPICNIYNHIILTPRLCFTRRIFRSFNDYERNKCNHSQNNECKRHKKREQMKQSVGEIRWSVEVAYSITVDCRLLAGW